MLGSLGVAIYRGQINQDLPASVPAEAAALARDTLGGAVSVAGQLPDAVGEPLLAVARGAFVDAMQLTSLLAAGLALGIAVQALVMFRDRPTASGDTDEEPAPDPGPQPFTEQTARIAPSQ
jgi:DHA2 family multidrug resistance protein-like MFS transporter